MIVSSVLPSTPRSFDLHHSAVYNPCCASSLSEWQTSSNRGGSNLRPPRLKKTLFGLVVEGTGGRNFPLPVGNRVTLHRGACVARNDEAPPAVVRQMSVDAAIALRALAAMRF